MYRLEENRYNHSENICQTIAKPIMVFDYLEFREALLGIGLIFYFGIIFTNPFLLTTCLIGLWGFWPAVRSRYERGVVVQKLYKIFGLNSSGIVRPPKSGRFAA